MQDDFEAMESLIRKLYMRQLCDQPEEDLDSKQKWSSYYIPMKEQYFRTLDGPRAKVDSHEANIRAPRGPQTKENCQNLDSKL